MRVLSRNSVSAARLLGSDVILRIKPVLLTYTAAAYRRAVILKGEQRIVFTASLALHGVIKYHACPAPKLDTKRLAHLISHSESVVHYFVLQRGVNRAG